MYLNVIGLLCKVVYIGNWKTKTKTYDLRFTYTLSKQRHLTFRIQ